MVVSTSWSPHDTFFWDKTEKPPHECVKHWVILLAKCSFISSFYLRVCRSKEATVGASLRTCISWDSFIPDDPLQRNFLVNSELEWLIKSSTYKCFGLSGWIQSSIKVGVRSGESFIRPEAEHVTPVDDCGLLLPGAYLVPYFILLLIIGIPLFFLELAVGQKVRRGSIGVWNYVCPSLGGIGMSSLMVRDRVGRLDRNRLRPLGGLLMCWERRWSSSIVTAWCGRS